jgi:signal transduction histidine kinase
VKVNRLDHVRDTRNIFALAAVLSVGFSGIGFLGNTLGIVHYSLIPAALCAVAGVLLSLAGFFLAPRVNQLGLLSRLILSGYILAATVAIHFAGGPQSFLAALYVAITVAAGFLTGQRGAIEIATLSLLSFSTLIALEFSGVLGVNPIWEPVLVLSDQEPILFALIFSMGVPTFVVAFATGTLADRLTQRNAEQVALTQIARDIASSLDPDRVIRTVLRRAIRITASDRGAIHLYDAVHESVRVTAAEALYRQTWSMADIPSHSSSIQIVSRALRNGQTVLINDVMREFEGPEYEGESRSRLCAPIVQEGRVEGAIYLERHRPNAFTPEHQRFVEQLAQHAAIGLNNARLYAETQRNLTEVARANLEVSTLQKSLSAVQSTLELDEVLQRICDAVVTLGHDMAMLSTQRRQRRLDVRAVSAADPAMIERVERIFGIPLVGVSIKLRHTRNIATRALAVKDVLISKELGDFLFPLRSHGRRGKALGQVGLKVGAAIPLIARDTPLGILYAFSSKPDLTAADLSSLQAFGAQAAVALDNAGLFEQARTARDRLQAVLDATHDGLILYNRDERMVLTNRAAERLLGVSLTPYLGQPMTQVLRYSGWLGRLYPDTYISNSERLVEDEVNFMRSGLHNGDGEFARRVIEVRGVETRYIQEFSLRVQDEHGQLVGRLIVLHDISDQKQLEKDRDVFTQMLVHDLRSPLSAIIGGLQMIEIGIVEHDEAAMLLESNRIALTSANKMLNLITSLLDVQKLETGQIELSLNAMQLSPIIEETADALRPLASQYKVTFEVDVDGDLPPIHGDAEQLRRVLTNLMDNAIKFVGSGGVVRVLAGRDGEYIKVSIIDNGPGIPQEYRKTVFERYVQVPGVTGRRSGTGLGLTFSKMVVEMHGGQIWVEPSELGGSAFSLRLPTINNHSG